MVRPSAASSAAASAVWPSDAAKRVLTVRPTTASAMAARNSAPASTRRPALRGRGGTACSTVARCRRAAVGSSRIGMETGLTLGADSTTGRVSLSGSCSMPLQAFHHCRACNPRQHVGLRKGSQRDDVAHVLPRRRTPAAARARDSNSMYMRTKRVHLQAEIARPVTGPASRPAPTAEPRSPTAPRWPSGCCAPRRGRSRRPCRAPAPGRRG